MIQRCWIYRGSPEAWFIAGPSYRIEVYSESLTIQENSKQNKWLQRVLYGIKSTDLYIPWVMKYPLIFPSSCELRSLLGRWSIFFFWKTDLLVCFEVLKIYNFGFCHLQLDLRLEGGLVKVFTIFSGKNSCSLSTSL